MAITLPRAIGLGLGLAGAGPAGAVVLAGAATGAGMALVLNDFAGNAPGSQAALPGINPWPPGSGVAIPPIPFTQPNDDSEFLECPRDHPDGWPPKPLDPDFCEEMGDMMFRDCMTTLKNYRICNNIRVETTIWCVGQFLM